MGRPLNQKYFGNYNKGSASTSSDDGMGGQGVAGVAITAAGSYAGLLPTVAFSAPSLPGVQATGSVIGAAVGASVATAGSGYAYHDVITAIGGTGNAATFLVTSLQTVNVVMTNGGTFYDVSGGAHDEIWFDSTVDARWTTPLKIRVETLSGSSIATFSIIQQGVWTGTSAPTSVTGTSTHNGPIDNNGHGATFTLTWGVNTVNVNTAGAYTAVHGNSLTTSGGSGSGATLNVSYGVSGISITEGGSGYLSVADAAVSFSPSGATGNPVLTTDQLNAVIVYAMVGSAVDAADAVQQIGASRYRVKTYEGVGVCKLVASTPANAGEMSINATDSDGGTYWVMRLNSCQALLVQNTGTQFANHTMVRWSFANPVQNYSVKIDNF